jgi:dipeptidyl aminopeptidase/acylaminoacyl peptidase
MTVDDVLTRRYVGTPAISPDGRHVAYVVNQRDMERNSSDSEVWLVSVEGGPPVRVAYSDKSDNGPQWAPDGSWLAFRSTRAGRAQIFGVRPEGGEAWQVSDWPQGVGQFRISPNGTWIAFTSSAAPTEADKALERIRGRPIVRDSAYTDQWTRLWAAPLEGGRLGKVIQVSPDTLHVDAGYFEWAPDSRGLAFGASPSPLTFLMVQVFVADAPGATTRQVTRMGGGSQPVAWTDVAGLLVRSTDSEFAMGNLEIIRVPLDGRPPVSLTEGIDGQSGFIGVTADWLYVSSKVPPLRAGVYRIRLRDGRAAGAPALVSDADGSLFYDDFSATPDARVAAFIANGPATPSDIYVSPIEAFSARRLTEVNPQFREIALGEQRVIRWKSRADGEEIEGVLVLPVGYREGTRVPLLVEIHGGPQGTFLNWFNVTRFYPEQVFAGAGYAVFMPNYRGSGFSGERFRNLTRGDTPGSDWIDIESGVDELIRLGIADPKRLGLFGHSYGGTLTYWGITQTNRYAAAMAAAGTNDLSAACLQSDFPTTCDNYIGPKPWEDPERYERLSAYRYVERVTTPLLMVHGERDSRNLPGQSIQFYNALRAIGKAPAKLVLLPGEEHGIGGALATREFASRTLAWFKQWIPVDGYAER